MTEANPAAQAPVLSSYLFVKTAGKIPSGCTTSDLTTMALLLRDFGTSFEILIFNRFDWVYNLRPVHAILEPCVSNCFLHCCVVICLDKMEKIATWFQHTPAERWKFSKIIVQCVSLNIIDNQVNNDTRAIILVHGLSFVWHRGQRISRYILVAKKCQLRNEVFSSPCSCSHAHSLAALFARYSLPWIFGKSPLRLPYAVWIEVWAIWIGTNIFRVFIGHMRFSFDYRSHSE